MYSWHNFAFAWGRKIYISIKRGGGGGGGSKPPFPFFPSSNFTLKRARGLMSAVVELLASLFPLWLSLWDAGEFVGGRCRVYYKLIFVITEIIKLKTSVSHDGRNKRKRSE